MELTKKEINAIRGALRTTFHRSEYYKTFLESVTFSVPRYKADGTRHKVDYKKCTCVDCGGDFLRNQINVDHKHPIGSFTSLNEIERFIKRLYCGYSNLQILCKECHKKKTAQERKFSRSLKDFTF